MHRKFTSGILVRSSDKHWAGNKSIIKIFRRLYPTLKKLPITIYEDNMPCIKITEYGKGSNKSNRKCIKYHMIKPMKGKETIEFCYLKQKMSVKYRLKC